MLRADVTTHHPVAQLAEERAVGRAEVVLTGDPVRRQGRFTDQVVARGSLQRLSARGTTLTGRVPVLLLGGRPGTGCPGQPGGR